MGAWIETLSATSLDNRSKSHPTWVRGLKLAAGDYNRKRKEVAPYVGAWIETDRNRAHWQGFESHPTWVRGLKLYLHIFLK